MAALGYEETLGAPRRDVRSPLESRRGRHRIQRVDGRCPFNLSVQVRFQFSKSPSSDVSRAFDLAKKAVEIDRDFAWGHIALGGAYLANGDPDGAVNAVRQALTLEPGGYEANLFMGFYLQFTGKPALAIEHLLLANRLIPTD